LNLKNVGRKSVLGAFAAMLGLGTFLAAPDAEAGTKKLLYFVRHGESGPQFLPTSTPGTFTDNCLPDRSCCTTPLTPIGLERGVGLRDWFAEHKKLETVTHLIATNKVRTSQTIQLIADATGVPIVKATGTAGECDVGFKGTPDSAPYLISAINALPEGAVAVIAGHGEAMYAIMAATTGIDTSDPVEYPKDATGRVVGFNHLWIIELDSVTGARLVRHMQSNLEFKDPSLGGT
jgi:hypothetical protein